MNRVCMLVEGASVFGLVITLLPAKFNSLDKVCFLMFAFWESMEEIDHVNFFLKSGKWIILSWGRWVFNELIELTQIIEDLTLWQICFLRFNMLDKITFTCSLVVTLFAIIFNSFMDRLNMLCKISFISCLVFTQLAIEYNSLWIEFVCW